MTVEELKAQISALESQLKILESQLGSSQMFPERSFNNYDYLVEKAESSFREKKYLEAFLIQSCIIEGVLKDYASKKLSSITSQSTVLKKKFESFEFARLIDELFISGKIKKDLYESLNAYRNKRNSIIHDLLEHRNKEELDRGLKESYELGKSMKGFIVDDMSRETEENLTIAESEAQVAALLAQLAQLQLQLIIPATETRRQ